MYFLPTISPDAALLGLTGGILLIYVELNRPGLILPGVLGLTLALLSLSRFLHASANPYAVAAFLLGLSLLALSTRTRARVLPAIFAAAALAYAFARPVTASSGARPHAALALLCAIFMAAGTCLLTTIAARARQNKGLDLQ